MRAIPLLLLGAADDETTREGALTYERHVRRSLRPTAVPATAILPEQGTYTWKDVQKRWLSGPRWPDKK